MIACVLIPHFGAALMRQHQPGLRADNALILVQYRAGRGRVYAADALAAAAGVVVGMPITRARALSPEADVVVIRPSLIRRIRTELLERFSQFSQYAEMTRDHELHARLLIDLGKLKPSLGASLGRQMIEMAAEAGYSAAVGIAENPFCAQIAAINAPLGQIRLISPAETIAFLAGQPSERLPASKETARRLDLFGLRTIGQVAAIPRSALILQFGEEGARLHRLANGQDGHRIPRYIPPETAESQRQFEPPVEDSLILDSVLNAMAAVLMETLTARDQTCGRVILTLNTDDGAELEATLNTREPIASAVDLARVLGRLFRKHTLHAPIERVSVQIGRFAQVKPRQLSLFDEDTTSSPHALVRDLSERYQQTYFYTIAASEITSPLPELKFTLETIEAA